MKLTEYQAEFLQYAADQDGVILSVGGGDDEKWWKEFSEKGWMESAPLPCAFKGGLGGLDWSAWRITPAGRAALEQEGK